MATMKDTAENAVAIVGVGAVMPDAPWPTFTQMLGMILITLTGFSTMESTFDVVTPAIIEITTLSASITDAMELRSPFAS